MVKIAWGITGCGDKIEEIVDMIVELKNEYDDLDVDIYYSKSAEMVLNWYKLMGKLKDTFYNIRKEVNSNAPFLPGMLQTGKYDLFLVAPVTANSVAKIAHGVADTLITNSVAQGAKAMVPTYIYPPDNKKEEIETILPGGKTLKLYIRDTDVENVNILKKMQSITILENVDDIRDVLLKHIKGD
ncbi:archaeoflavoprotein AfpA [Methanococcus maripaludis]|uniref:Archaeoflavoprotein AfpA n=1 Tax=Methanococcus maripaludis TaxID=39152 RepID=A0A7J9NPG2_METMI|nr:archaeoflavoprotein AfpA [Methanococcus maripaludis]MBA2847062.1 archaeoflavoprotein AfpA [Methanococcus maripaludis]